MKTLSIYVVLVALLFKKATAVALPEQQFHVMKNTEFGPVYSNVSPNRRRDFVDSTFSPADENALGINYSNIAPSATKRSEAYIPLEASEVMAFVEEHGLNKALEKRADWKTCLLCVAGCGLMQPFVGMNFSTDMKVLFCFANCIDQGACSEGQRYRYNDQYGNNWPPPEDMRPSP